MYCEYYQATILKKKTWFLSANMRNESNLVFARALKKDVVAPRENPLFEFFVPRDQEQFFLILMKTLQEMGVVLSLEKKPNRLAVG